MPGTLIFILFLAAAFIAVARLGLLKKGGDTHLRARAR